MFGRIGVLYIWERTLGVGSVHRGVANAGFGVRCVEGTRRGRGVSMSDGVNALWFSKPLILSLGNASSVGPQEKPMNAAVVSSSRERVGKGEDLERRIDNPGDDP